MERGSWLTSSNAVVRFPPAPWLTLCRGFAGVADDLPSDLARRMCGLAERLGDSSTFMTPEELHSLRSDQTTT